MRFIALTLAFLIAFYVALGFFSFPLSLVSAVLPQALLGLLGTQTELAFEGGAYHLVAGGWDAEIGEACWGRLELSVLFATILASENRALKKRLKGAAFGGFLALFAFNPVRITASLLTMSETVHDVLFRVSLLVALVGYYAWWYKKEKGV